VPVARALARDYEVTGVDLSPVQVERARSLVPEATFVCDDITAYAIEPVSWDAIVSLYALIHVPMAEQPDLIGRMACGLRPGGRLLATVGHEAWTGTEENWCGVAGATMYWSHADVATYRRWLEDARLEVLDEWFVPEGEGGHSMLYARPARRDRPPASS
jgi:SAM-dependent methyltransferase